MPMTAKQRERERAHRLEINALRETLRIVPRCIRCGIIQSAIPAGYECWRAPCEFRVLGEREMKAMAFAEIMAARGARDWWRKKALER